LVGLSLERKRRSISGAYRWTQRHTERQIEDEHEQTLKLGNGWNFPSEGFRWRGGEIYGSQYWEAHDRRQEEYKRDSEARQIREAKHNEECRQARTA
jgi:hypothetical protein